MDSDPDREVEPVDTLDEADGLVPISIKLKSPGGSKTLGIHLRGMGWQANHTGAMDGVRSQIDASSSHMDVPSAQTDVNKSAKAPEIVSTPQQTPKLADIPIENGPQKSQTSSGSAQ